MYEALGYSRVGQDVYEDRIQNVRLCFLQRVGDPLIELVAPVGQSSPVAGILNKVRTSPYHTCYEVTDIVATQATLRESGLFPVGRIVPAVAFDGRLVCFMYSPYAGLVELLAE